jgi:hypothetical protein
LRIFVVEIGPDVHNNLSARVIILDAAGQRYVPRREGEAGGLGNRDTQMFNAIFTLDPKTLPPDKAVYVGVEQRKPRPG